MFGNFNQGHIDNPENEIEIKRQKLADEVKLSLEKYQSQIVNFNFGTVTNLRGDIDHLNNLFGVKYDNRYKEYFRTNNFDEHSEKIKGNGYVYFKPSHTVNFEAYLGGDLRLGDYRNGNKFFLTIVFDKNGNVENENKVIDSIMKLLETIIPYEVNSKNGVPNDKQQSNNIKNITKEGLPVLMALKDIGQKYETNSLKMQDIINEYK